ncbi:MAG: DHH family phosphoesterase [Defluviitaleaceae bacterium]|nr:DHH family phosphoesterase [Defluviitaleaceae bacterium]
MFKLSSLLSYDNIIIQCHNTPDPDSLASGFGVYSYLKENGKNARIVYSGFEEITKKNILLMVEFMAIPAEYVKNTAELGKADLLICVDCQYGEGNVSRIEADTVAIIDHHIEVKKDERVNADLTVIHSSLGSCSTLVWGMLKDEGYDFKANKAVAMALYYGLLTDTNDFSELNHPYDRDARDFLEDYYDQQKIRALRNCNYSLEELEISAAALLNNIKEQNKRYVVFEAAMCDPNILGFISDTGIKVDSVDVCIVYSDRGSGVKLSVRSCVREVMASDYVKYLTDGVGSGGGHKDKAGGYIEKSKTDALGVSVVEHIVAKSSEYFMSFNNIYAERHDLDVTAMKQYMKKALPIGYIVSTDIFDKGTPIMLRTLEGDSRIIASPDIYLRIGIEGEVYATRAEKFHSSNRLCDEAVTFDISDYSYTPNAKNELTGEVKELFPYMKSCVPTGNNPIYAAELECNTKVFNDWNPDGYMFGKKGDFLAIRCDDVNDVYIIRGDIFYKTYDEVG